MHPNINHRGNSTPANVNTGKSSTLQVTKQHVTDGMGWGGRGHRWDLLLSQA